MEGTYCHTKRLGWNFPGGEVDKNPPANAGGMGFITGLGRIHMPWNNSAHVPQLLSLCRRAHEPQISSLCAETTEACTSKACALQQRGHCS